MTDIYLFEKPYATINGEGHHIGKPCVFIRFQGCTVGCVWCDAMGTWPEKKGDQKIGICMTAEEITEYLDKNFPRIKRLWITGGEPTEHAQEAFDLIRYYKAKGQFKRIFHMITSGKIYHHRLMRELDQITIDVKPPSSHALTPNDFISFCMEDQEVRKKIEFKMVVSCDAEDITFARNTIDRLKHFKRDITIQPLYWSEAEARKQEDIGQTIQNLKVYQEQFAQPSNWKSYGEFAEEFMDTVDYENVRVLPQLHKIYWPGVLSGI